MLSHTPRPSGCTCPCHCAVSTSPLADAAEGQLNDTCADARALCTCPCSCTSTVGGEPKCCCVCPAVHEDVAVPLGPSLSWLGDDMDQVQDGCLGDEPTSAAPAESTVARSCGEVGGGLDEAPAHTPIEAPSTLQPTEPCSPPTMSTVLLQSPQVFTGNSAPPALPTMCFSTYVCAVNIEPTPPSPRKSELRRELCDMRVPAWLVKLAVGACKMKCEPRNRPRRRWSAVPAHRPNSSSGSVRVSTSSKGTRATATPAVVGPRGAGDSAEVGFNTMHDLSTVAATDVVHAGPAQFMPAMVLPPLRLPLAGTVAPPSIRSAAVEIPPSLAVRPVAEGEAPRPIANQPPSVRAPLGLLQQPLECVSDPVRSQPAQSQAPRVADVERLLAPRALPEHQTRALGRPPHLSSHLSLGVTRTGNPNDRLPAEQPRGVPSRPWAATSMRPSTTRLPLGAMRPPRSRATLPAPPVGSSPTHRTYSAHVQADRPTNQGCPDGMGEKEWDSLCVLVTDLAEKAFKKGKAV